MNRRETISRTLCAENLMGGNGCDGCDPIHGCQNWTAWARDYDRTIARLREPTARQVDAGRRELINLTWSWRNGKPKHSQLEQIAKDLWRSMIDELQHESEETDGKTQHRRNAEALFASTAD